jgi:hypothetical protein
MLKILNNITNLFDSCFKTILSIFRIVAFSKTTKGLKNYCSADKEIFILGNGHSLKESFHKHGEMLKEKSLMAVNYFGLSNEYTIYKPKYYIAIDRIMYVDNYDEVYENKNQKLFKKLANTTDWDMILFMPHDAKKYNKWQSYLKYNNHIKIIYINLTPIEGNKAFRHFAFNKNYGMPRPFNILVAAIYSAIKMDINKIYLLGADHSWLRDIIVDEKNELLIVDNHFYDETSNPRKYYYNLEEGKKEIKYHEALFAFMTSFKSYYILKEYAKSKSIKIINCTKKSYIDAFEKIDLSEI